MDIRDLMILKQKASTAQGVDVAFGVDPKGEIWLTAGYIHMERLSVDDLHDKLCHLCTPPKPKTVTITVPFESAEKMTEFTIGGYMAPFEDECKRAISPYVTRD